MNYKIKIGENNQKLCELVQKKLFEMGYTWLSGGQQVLHTDSFALFLEEKCLGENKIITQTPSDVFYAKSKNQELSIKDVLDGNLPEQEQPDKLLEPISCRVTTDNKELADFLFSKAASVCGEAGGYPGYSSKAGAAVLLRRDAACITGAAKAYSSWESGSIIYYSCVEVSVEKFLENLELLKNIKRPVKFELNEKYVAEYPIDGKVQVGCQFFDLEKIKELVQKCEEYDKSS